MKQIFKFIIAVIVVYLLFYFSVVSFDALLTFIDNSNIRTSIGLGGLAILLIVGTYFRFYFCASLFGISISKPLLISASSEAYTLGQIIPGQLGIDGLRILKLKRLDKTKFKKSLLAATLVEKIISLITQLFVFFLLIFIMFRVEINISKLLIAVSLIFFFCFLLFRFAKYIIEKKLRVTVQNGLGLPLVRIFSYCVILNLVACSLIYGISEVMFGFKGVSFVNTSLAMLASNISAAIPITPNGVGLSEFLFSKILSIVGEKSRVEFYGSSYLIYRVLNIAGHACIHFATILKDSIPWRYRFEK